LTRDSSLLTDPKSRKVIVIEHPLLPLHIKDMIARILFTNLQVCKEERGSKKKTHEFDIKVPYVSFAPSHLLSLLAVGRITGLVLDCGHLESAVLPVCSPIFREVLISLADEPRYSLLAPSSTSSKPRR